MDRNDRQAIATLFDRLAEAERQSPPRDPEAEAFIRENIGQQPGAPYYMAQTIVVQQQALEAAQDRIAELEARGNGNGNGNGNGGFFGSLFGDGGNDRQPQRRGQSPSRGQPAYDDRRQPWGNNAGGGGGFLAGAAQTAMGVAGGVLIGNMLAGALFGGNDAQAADSAEAGQDADAGDSFDGGDDFGGDF